MTGIVGQWLSLGGSAAYMFGYVPNVPINQYLPCAGYGDMMLFTADKRGQADRAMPTFQAARLLSQVWTVPGHGLHELIGAKVEGAGETPEIVAYAVQRPDHRLGLMLINRSATHSHRVTVTVEDPILRLGNLADVYSYGPRQYAWLDAGERSRVARSLPPQHRRQPTDAALSLAPSSITVVVAPMLGQR